MRPAEEATTCGVLELLTRFPDGSTTLAAEAAGGHHELNDTPRQRQIGSTADLVYSIPELLVFMSGFMTLRPGDLLITGTPPGRVSVGAGDSLRVEIDGLGSLENVVTAESSVAHREASS